MSPPESITILHVDDDRQFGELTQLMLERNCEEFEVITETDPREVERLLDERDVDCLVTDYEMPHINGVELLKRVRDRNSSLPVILCTSKSVS